MGALEAAAQHPGAGTPTTMLRGPTVQLGVPVTPAGPHGHAPCEVHCEFRLKPGW